jgi:hypothetical protein
MNGIIHGLLVALHVVVPAVIVAGGLRFTLRFLRDSYPRTWWLGFPATIAAAGIVLLLWPFSSAPQKKTSPQVARVTATATPKASPVATARPHPRPTATPTATSTPKPKPPKAKKPKAAKTKVKAKKKAAKIHHRHKVPHTQPPRARTPHYRPPVPVATPRPRVQPRSRPTAVPTAAPTVVYQPRVHQVHPPVQTTPRTSTPRRTPKPYKPHRIRIG